MREGCSNMENENKWEYDYSASDNETGYPNVGSSGMNTAKYQCLVL